MTITRRAIGTFANYEVTEIALHELKNSGYMMDQVSVVGRDINNHSEMAGANTGNRLTDNINIDTHENEAGEVANKGAVVGSTFGGLAGLLIGLGAMAIPGIGPVMLAGAVATSIATAISGGVIGAATGSLVGALVGLRIPTDLAQVYSDRVSQGDYLVIIDGTESEIAVAESIFKRSEINEWHTYDLMSNLETAATDSTHQPLT